MKLENRQHNDILILKLDGELSIFFKDDLENLLLDEIDKKKRRKFIFDLSDVSYIDSSGLSLLIMAGHASKQAGLNLKIVNPKPPVRYVINIACIDELISYCESVDAAIDEYSIY